LQQGVEKFGAGRRDGLQDRWPYGQNKRCEENAEQRFRKEIPGSQAQRSCVRPRRNLPAVDYFETMIDSLHEFTP